MTPQNAFRSAFAKDALRYIALKRTLGRSFENATSVLLNLDRFLCAGNPSADLTRRHSAVESGPRVALAEHQTGSMRIVRNFCIYRRRMVPDCFVPDPSQFPKACPCAAATHLFRSRSGATTRSLRRTAGRSCAIPSALGGYSPGDRTPLHYGPSPRRILPTDATGL